MDEGERCLALSRSSSGSRMPSRGAFPFHPHFRVWPFPTSEYRTELTWLICCTFVRPKLKSAFERLALAEKECVKPFRLCAFLSSSVTETDGHVPSHCPPSLDTTPSSRTSRPHPSSRTSHKPNTCFTPSFPSPFLISGRSQ